MPKCSFCHKVYQIPYGLTYVLSDGTVLHLCSSKCRKNFHMGRKNRNLAWVRKMKPTGEIIQKTEEVKEEKAVSKKEEKK